jgi:orotidine-5'-phosphate decarboxylase
MASNHKKILVALDVSTLDEALKLVEQLRDLVGGFKVGLELCTSVGTQQVIDAISKAGGNLFVDLKFKDVPNTVSGAAKACAREGVLMMNVHCDGGSEMMSAAVTAVRASSHQPMVIGVTVLTSISEQTLNIEMRVPGKVETQVVALAGLAQKAGLNGVVCSPHEVKAIKEACGKDFVTVVPGVRPEWAAANDQKRIMTPRQAVEAGADFLVIGRPITKPPAAIGTVVDAAKRIVAELPQ